MPTGFRGLGRGTLTQVACEYCMDARAWCCRCCCVLCSRSWYSRQDLLVKVARHGLGSQTAPLLFRIVVGLVIFVDAPHFFPLCLPVGWPTLLCFVVRSLLPMSHYCCTAVIDCLGSPLLLCI